MVRSIHHWCQVAGLIERDGVDSNNRRGVMPTDLGAKIFADDGFDPYLEDAATLWAPPLAAYNKRQPSNYMVLGI